MAPPPSAAWVAAQRSTATTPIAVSRSDHQPLKRDQRFAAASTNHRSCGRPVADEILLLLRADRRMKRKPECRDPCGDKPEADTALLRTTAACPTER